MGIRTIISKVVAVVATVFGLYATSLWIEFWRFQTRWQMSEAFAATLVMGVLYLVAYGFQEFGTNG